MINVYPTKSCHDLGKQTHFPVNVTFGHTQSTYASQKKGHSLSQKDHNTELSLDSAVTVKGRIHNFKITPTTLKKTKQQTQK